MLDDLKMIHQRDASDALGIAQKQSQQYLHNFGFVWQPAQPVHEVIVAGMGGSGLAARAYSVFSDINVPFEILQGYDLPDRVGQNTLLICSSYSGNTEETVTVLEQALNADRPQPRPMIVLVSSGGKLAEMAKANNLPMVELPAGYQPRHTFGFQYRALAEIMSQTGLKDNEIKEIESAAQWLNEQTAEFLPTVPARQNPAKCLALELMGKSVVVYGGNLMFPAAYKWKISINENAKHIAWCGQYSEFNHNEMLGWTAQPVDKPYAVIELRSSLEHPRIQKRYEVTEKLLSGKRPSPEVVSVKGSNKLQQMMWAVMYGDFVSLYLALLNGLDPTPVDLIEKFKRELAS